MLRALPALALISIAGCAQIPEVEQAVGDGAADQPFPKIAPIAQIDTAAADKQLTEEQVAAFEAEAAALKRRGRLLRNQPVQ